MPTKYVDMRPKCEESLANDHDENSFRINVDYVELVLRGEKLIRNSRKLLGKDYGESSFPRFSIW